MQSFSEALLEKRFGFLFLIPGALQIVPCAQAIRFDFRFESICVTGNAGRPDEDRVAVLRVTAIGDGKLDVTEDGDKGLILIGECNDDFIILSLAGGETSLIIFWRASDIALLKID